MWKYALGLLLTGSLQLFGQDYGCFIPDGQTVYSEVCCAPDLCPPDCSLPCSPFPVLLVDIQGGIRRDSLSFSVKHPNGAHHRYLHQKYSKIKSATGGISAWFQINRQWYLRGYGDYANITHGKEKQVFHNSGGVFTHDYQLQANQGYLYDFSGGIGWIFPCPFYPLTFAAVGGYSQEGQNIKSHKAKLHTVLGNQGRVPGRHSKLRLTWTGPWAGLDFALRYQGIKLSGTCEYHWARFRGTENLTAGGGCINNCNTTNKLRANGQGLVAVLSVTRMFCQNWRFGFAGKAQWWRTKDGRYSENGEHFRLNRVKWNSGSLTADLGYRF